MAQYDGSIRINTSIDQRGFERGSRGLIQGMTRLGNSLRGMVSSLGFGLGIAGLVALGKQAIDTASDIQEVQNVVDTAFGSMSYKMEEFAQNSVKQFGISQLSAKQLGSTFMAMGASMLDSAETASDMAINLTARAADMASFYNKSVQETSTALKSIYTGETESLKEYGVVMTQVNLQEFARQRGINKSIQAMTQAEKVQLQYAYVMEQTSLAAGDFARTSDSWANQTRILSEQFKELLSVSGSGLIVVFTPVVKFLNTVLSTLIAIAKQIGAILSKLFGISIPVADSGKFADDMSAAAGGADDLAEGIEAAGKAAKGALAPFDKLNVLSQDKGGGKGGAGAGGGFEMPSLEMKETEVEEVDAMSSAIDNLLDRMQPLFDWFTKLKNLFVEGFFDGLGESWKDRIADIEESARNIIKTLREIFTDPSVVAAAQTMIEKIVYAMGQVVGSLVSIGITIAQNIVGGIDKYLEQNKEFLKQKLVSIFDITGDIALLIGEACDTIAYIFEAFGSENGQQLTANIIGIFNNTIMSLLELASKFGRDILNCIIKPISDNKEDLRNALDGALGVVSEVTGTILDGINETFAELNKVYDEHLKPFFDSIANGLSDTLGKFLDFWNGSVKPILDEWAQNFDTLWKEHIQPTINKFIGIIGKVSDLLKAVWENVLKPLIDWVIENILPTFLPIVDTLEKVVMTLWGTISDVVGNIIDAFGGVIDFLTGVFSGDWDKAWNGIVDTFKSIFNIIPTVVEGVINTAIDIINGIIGGINIVSSKVPGVPSIPEIKKVSIPRLADGAVIRGGDPFMAVLGDQRRGQTNIETPLPTMVKAFKQAIAETGGIGGDISVRVFLGEKDITKAVKTEANSYFKRTGKGLFAY